jgi:DNA repair exonuclease SbcCD ATPase subunit
VAPNPLPVRADGNPIEITSANAGKHLDWLRAEVGRFDAYVARQMEGLRRRRDELAAAESAAANTLVARDLLSSREKAELEADRASLAAERDGLARRAAELDRAERALQRRSVEVDELEQLLRGELEEREAEIERQRRSVGEALADLRVRAPLTTSTDDLLDAGHCG